MPNKKESTPLPITKDELQKIIIDFTKNGAEVEVIRGDVNTLIPCVTPIQSIMVTLYELSDEHRLRKDIENYLYRIHDDHSEIIDELLYDKLVEVAEFATKVKKSLYTNNKK